MYVHFCLYYSNNNLIRINKLVNYFTFVQHRIGEISFTRLEYLNRPNQNWNFYFLVVKKMKCVTNPGLFIILKYY